MSSHAQNAALGAVAVVLGYALWHHFKPESAAKQGDLIISPNGIPIGSMSDADRNFLHGTESYGTSSNVYDVPVLSDADRKFLHENY